MDKETRTRIQRATQAARALLEHEYAEQLGGVFDIRADGTIAPEPGSHLDAGQRVLRSKIVAAVEHHRQGGLRPDAAVATYTREAAFTTLNRFVALEMLEARGLVQECVSRDDQSAGFKEFVGLAPGLVQVPDHGYRLYIESIFDEIGREVRVLFDRLEPASLLWPGRQALLDLLALLNAGELAEVWREDETIGWVYQYFNGDDERAQMRDVKRGGSQAPRNSRELAVRNQFFTPRYVVEFLVDNTLGRTWIEMTPGTALADRCRYFVRTEEESTRARERKDPRDLRVLDPACGSGHFLLYSFDLLLTIYEEAWTTETAGPCSQATGRRLRDEYPDLASLRTATPSLILEHNVHGVDIDPRAAQIAALALWLRAQRAWKDSGVPAAERPAVRRTHIVVAEPMPGDAALVEEFAAGLDPPLLRDLFRKMVGEMRLAGELGTLIPVEKAIAAALCDAREQFVARQMELDKGFLPGVEPVRKQGELDLSGIDDDSFFLEAETRFMTALRHFAEAAGGVGVKRRLFVGDAAQGIALIDLLRTRFDVVLMNPPFGAPTERSEPSFNEHYPEAAGNMYAAFLARPLLVPGGRVGALVSSTCLYYSSFERLRKEVLLGRTSLRLLADLGGGVLDSATVKVAAVVAEEGSTGADQLQRTVQVVRCVEADDKERGLREACACWTGPVWTVPLAVFRELPRSTVAYWLPDSLRAALQRFPKLGDEFAVAARGCDTGDNFRFLRLRWEVPQESGAEWLPYAKGGEFSPYLSSIDLVIKWAEGGHEIRSVTNSYLRNEALQGCEGVSYPLRAAMPLNCWHLPAGTIFAGMSPAIIPQKMGLRTLLGWSNTYIVRFLVGLQLGGARTEPGTAANAYHVGILQQVAVPESLVGEDEVAPLVDRILALLCSVSARDETRTGFTSPFADAGVSRDASVWWARIEAELSGLIARVDCRVEEAYLLSGQDSQWLHRAYEAPSVRQNLGGDALWTAEEGFCRSVSYAVGLIFGRWQPAHMTPLHGSCPVAELPLEQLTELVDRQLEAFAVTECQVERSDLERFLSLEFFASHLKMYSAGGRAAPVYWQLATASARYSVWLYIQRFTKDTLFRVQNDCVGPKLTHEERRLTNLIQGAGGSPSPSQRKEIAEQESFVEELRAMLAEVKRVAPLWNPDLNDGVIINFAPLWRLVPQHRVWQKECKDCWDRLVAGEYDWAHLAMHLWPERVVPKCAEDRSLAIAHDLEDAFWVEGPDGKWQKGEVDSVTVARLVADRTSPAVKDALRSLLEAPASSSPRGRSRRAASLHRAAANEALR